MELIVSNVVDCYRESVALIQDPALKQHEVLDSYYIEDRSLLWCGASKLVVTSLPVEPGHLRYLQGAMGYRRLENLWPASPTESLCEDILREDALRARIVSRLRGAGAVPLISFVGSAQVLAVAEALRREDLEVYTPECPPADRLWVRDYLDSKAGFREFFSNMQPPLDGVRLPQGAVGRDTAQAAHLAATFLEQGRACLCKPNNSQSGVGFLILRPGELAGDGAGVRRSIQARLDANPQMTCDCIVVEELIDMDPRVGGGSPSIEMRVPADPAQDVEFMYLCGQILTPKGYFFGVEMYRDVLGPELERSLEEVGRRVAREVRRAGYVGVFDMDLVVGRDGGVYAVEINTRRTGGTHAHEAAEFLFGRRYWERVAAISNNVLIFQGPKLDYAGLQGLLRGILFPMGEPREGILPTIVSSLASNRIGYVAFGASIGRARELERTLHERLAASGRPLAHDHL